MALEIVMELYMVYNFTYSFPRRWNFGGAIVLSFLPNPGSAKKMTLNISIPYKTKLCADCVQFGEKICLITDAFLNILNFLVA